MNNTHDIIDDRIDVVTRGLMGLTVTCARCHDHKFDPIPSADYYSLYGVFRSSMEPTVPPTRGRRRRAATTTFSTTASSTIREKKLVDFVTEKHAGLVNGARARAAEYLLAAHAARNQPPADDFMLLADPGDLNPSMITRWRQFLADAKKREAIRAGCTGTRSPICRTPSSRRKPQALLKAVERSNRLVAAAFAEPAEVDEGGRGAIRQAPRRGGKAMETSSR